MSDNQLVTVIIPFYNCSYVQSAIESVLNQSYTPIEVIVVNDGSTQHNELIQPYLSRIVYIEKENGGVSTALNLGLQLAKGNYIAWLSSDDMFAQEKIEKQLQFMLSRKAEISFTNFNIINEKNFITSPNVVTFYRNPNEVLKSLEKTNPINGCTVMMSRKLVNQIGVFNEGLKYTQDYDYWIRCAFRFPIHYFNMTLTDYRVHSQMGSIVHNKAQMEELLELRKLYRPKFNQIFHI